MTCPVCFHSNYNDLPGDDLEAACNCDCHNEIDESQETDESVEIIESEEEE